MKYYKLLSVSTGPMGESSTVFLDSFEEAREEFYARVGNERQTCVYLVEFHTEPTAEALVALLNSKEKERRIRRPVLPLGGHTTRATLARCSRVTRDGQEMVRYWEDEVMGTGGGGRRWPGAGEASYCDTTEGEESDD